MLFNFLVNFFGFIIVKARSKPSRRHTSKRNRVILAINMGLVLLRPGVPAPWLAVACFVSLNTEALASRDKKFQRTCTWIWKVNGLTIIILWNLKIRSRRNQPWVPKHHRIESVSLPTISQVAILTMRSPAMATLTNNALFTLYQGTLKHDGMINLRFRDELRSVFIFIFLIFGIFRIFIIL